ncbi:MAG: isopentenyl transferase family protein, partial [Gammaproteobacteria bacterium]
MRNIKNTQTPIIFLMGPTASGKTSIAVDLVKSLPADIISVDSAMVFRGLDIGTAKPSVE